MIHRKDGTSQSGPGAAAASTRRSRSTTTSTAASCRSCCASSSPRRRRRARSPYRARAGSTDCRPVSFPRSSRSSSVMPITSHPLRRALPLFLLRGLLPDLARHDGEVPRARPLAVPGRLGALRGADARRDAVRRGTAPDRASGARGSLPLQLLRSAFLLVATVCFFARAALPAARRRLGDHVPRADLHRRALAAGAGRAADARALDRRRSPASSASSSLLRPGSAVLHPAVLLLDRRPRSFNALYQLLTRKLPGDRPAHDALLQRARRRRRALRSRCRGGDRRTRR